LERVVHLLSRKGLCIGVDMLLECRLVTDGCRSIILLLVKRQASRMIIGIIIIWVTNSGRRCSLSILLGSDLLCSEEATARAARTHGVFMATFLEIRLYEGKLG
jgi:hypothetical protein